MTAPLFSKLAYFTDIHFGRNGNNPQANADNLAFLAWFIEQAKARGCETCIFGGDWFDNRNAIHLLTMRAGIDGLRLLSGAFEKVIILPGNHDLFYREKRDVTSIEFAHDLPNTVIVAEPTRIGDVLMLPWLCGDEKNDVKRLSKGVRYVFGHLEVPGFLMNGQTEMPEAPHATQPDQFDMAELVVTGHFHKRQRKGNILYAGNAMPFNFGDAWDDERGAMFMDWGGEPQFASWPDQPVYRTGKLSDVLARSDVYFQPGASVRAVLDVDDMTFEEAQRFRDEVVATCDIRRFEIMPDGKSDAHAADVDLPAFRSVDEIVTEGLMAVESAGLDPERLVAIWRELADTGA